MKPLFIFLTVLSSFFTSSSFASEGVSPVVLKNFQTTFGTAKEVSWSITDSYYKANFILNDQYVTAFFNDRGELMAATRNISSVQLPLVLQSEIKREFSNYWITDLFELSNQDGTFYYLTIEDADTKVVLKSSQSGWSVFQKSRKA